MNTSAAPLDAEIPRKFHPGRGWEIWPAYEAAAEGLMNFWYPVAWSNQITEKPRAVRLCGKNLVLVRSDKGAVHALNDRCPHRGVRLSQGTVEFPGTLSCPYHGWTYRLTDGELVAVITDGPKSPMCRAVAVRTYAVEERIGLVWVFMGDRAPPPLEQQLPEELVDPPHFAVGGRIEERDGNYRFYAENGFDEGHAKYLHRTALWRLFKVMPTWNKIHIERVGRWLFRVEDERHWEADYPGVGKWTNKRWWKIMPRQTQGRFLGNVGGAGKNDPYIQSRNFAGFASLSLPGVLRIAYPQFIHYEFYVPIDAKRTRYVGVMVQFKSGLGKAFFYLKYLLGIRWLFHGQFSGQDHWMVSETDAPPERLYRPDISIIEWRKLFTQRAEEEKQHRPPHEPTAPPDSPLEEPT
jgi:phenylpropionate dioxygenase-like ring-hydroxylating dioxygenase large terminal subunit